ncbi:enoyl-CoA hydratase/isomerase [Phenylobacterium sp.]|uniref:enoyl-CoA hydratase/isomerase n=1 Tax=Phenylobacterium sp. TaxID=1871053 RepID=UPI002734D0CD|nr:enoyl-CoA hydratase/isomerase [Phenylobacterium sp.]MDP3658747.1 enoyl-CoA hydratase/isomerase [Phenylobacterium sp.]
MSQKKVKTSVEAGVARIVLDDPATMNAADGEVFDGLYAAFKRFADPASGARCIVLTGTGRGFCSGANLTSLGGSGQASDVESDFGMALETVVNPLVVAIRDHPLPILTLVNGAAAGVGCSFALMGDIVVAAESAYFLQAFRRIGLVPDGGSTYLLGQLVGKARAMEMALLGEKIPARTALEWGLINRCVPDAELEATGAALARQLADGPASLGHIRRLVWGGLESSFEEQLHAERVTQRLAGRTADASEGIAAFLEKRPARFIGS